MQWEATDQFGNLYVGASKSEDVGGLEDELRSMLTELRERGAETVTLTCDFEYGEINGPDPDQVSHILQVPWFSDCAQDETIESIQLEANGLAEELKITVYVLAG